MHRNGRLWHRRPTRAPRGTAEARLGRAKQKPMQSKARNRAAHRRNPPFLGGPTSCQIPPLLLCCASQGRGSRMLHRAPLRSIRLQVRKPCVWTARHLRQRRRLWCRLVRPCKGRMRRRGFAWSRSRDFTRAFPEPSLMACTSTPRGYRDGQLVRSGACEGEHDRGWMDEGCVCVPWPPALNPHLLPYAVPFRLSRFLSTSPPDESQRPCDRNYSARYGARPPDQVLMKRNAERRGTSTPFARGGRPKANARRDTC